MRNKTNQVSSRWSFSCVTHCHGERDRMCRRRRTVRQWFANSLAYSSSFAQSHSCAFFGQPLRHAQQPWIWLAGVEYRDDANGENYQHRNCCRRNNAGQQSWALDSPLVSRLQSI